MRMVVFIGVLAASSLLAGCLGASGGNSSSGKVAITCAGTDNAGNGCNGSDVGFSLMSSAYADSGIVRRGETIWVAMEAENNTSGLWMGYYELVFDAGCNGADEWVMGPKSPVTIEPGDSFSDKSGGECGDMELGERTLTATLYEADAQAIRDQVVVEFTLIE